MEKKPLKITKKNCKNTKEKIEQKMNDHLMNHDQGLTTTK